mgnify:CR=1 FL=1
MAEVKRSMQDKVAEINLKDYLMDNSKYSQCDERGVPTHDIDGKPLDEKTKQKLEAKYKRLLRLVNRFKE